MDGRCDKLWNTAVKELSQPQVSGGDWRCNLAATATNTRNNLANSARIAVFVLVFLMFVMLVPVIAVATVIFSIYRFALTALVWFKEGMDATFVDGDDAMWLQDAAVSRAIINIMLIFDGTPDIEQIRAIFYERLAAAVDGTNNGDLLFPKLQQYTARVYRRHVWRNEEKFDIKDHVYLHKTALPEEKLGRERLIGEICSEALPDHKSAWQVVVIATEQPAGGTTKEEDKFYILFRVHHSLADGISLIRMLMYNLVDRSPPRATSTRFCADGRLWRAAMALVAGPLLLAERFAWRADVHHLHGKPLIGDKRVSWSEPIDLNIVKQIRKATGATVNDVLVCCLTGAFREYFRTHAAEESLARSIKAYVPVDIRPAAFDMPTMTNQFALVLLNLSIGDEEPLTMLRSTKRSMDLIKRSPEPIVNAMTITYGMNYLPNWLTQSVFDWLSSKCTMVMSNVPGPATPMTIAGHKMEGVIFWPPQRGNIGLGVSIFSYNGFIRIGILSDSALLAEPQLIVNEFPRKVQQLVDCLKIE